MDIMRQSASLVENPNTVDSHGFLFNCMLEGQDSDLMMAWHKALIRRWVPDACCWLGPP